MRVARPCYDRESCYYHVFNRVSGESDWYPFEPLEREMMFQIMGRLNGLYALDIVSFVAMGNHFHAIIMVPAGLPSPAEVARRFATYYGSARPAPDWQIEDNYQMHARRLRDVGALMKDFQQHFTTWFNKSRPQLRRGRLWAERFRSVILERGRAVWECMRYVETNPVRAGLVADPADYWHSTWGRLGATGRHAFGVALAEHLPADCRDMLVAEGEELGSLSPTLSDTEIVACLRRNLARLATGDAGMAGGQAATGAGAKREPAFTLTTHRRVRHWSDGAIIGSKPFVRALTAELYGAERAARKCFDDSRCGLVSFRQLRRLD